MAGGGRRVGITPPPRPPPENANEESNHKAGTYRGHVKKIFALLTNASTPLPPRTHKHI